MYIGSSVLICTTFELENQGIIRMKFLTCHNGIRNLIIQYKTPMFKKKCLLLIKVFYCNYYLSKEMNWYACKYCHLYTRILTMHLSIYQIQKRLWSFCSLYCSKPETYINTHKTKRFNLQINYILWFIAATELNWKKVLQCSKIPLLSFSLINYI